MVLMEKGNILIIDDDPVIRNVFRDVFSQTVGYTLDTAQDGYEGIKKIKEQDYDVVFTDLTMPGMTGIDFIREAKKIRHSLPVVVLTGYSTLENAVNAMREGARDFITKPFNVRTLLSIVERIAGEARLCNRILANSDYQSFIGKLNAELVKKVQEIGILQAISTELDGIYNNKEIYERIVEMASRLLMTKEVSFGIIEGGVFRIKRAIGALERDIPLAGTLLEMVMRTRNYCVAQHGMPNPHTGVPLEAQFISIPLTVKDEVFGILNLSAKADGTSFTEDEISLAVTFAKKAAQRIENNALYEMFYNNLIDTLKSLVISIEARDSYTRHHSERVTKYALQIADRMDLGREEKEAIRFGGYLHDIGKIGVRDTILLKPDRLTAEEMKEIRLHPVIGGNIIKPIHYLPREREMIVHHHERFDGKGYPNGISGNDIPITARILAVADAFDAMTSSRPYRNTLTHKEAVNEIVRCSNAQFDGAVVKAFLQTPAGRGELHAA